MSILFEALHKAAQDYKAKKDPIILPLIKMDYANSSYPLKSRPILLVISVFILGTLLSCAVYSLQSNETESIKYIKVPANVADNKKSVLSDGIIIEDPIRLTSDKDVDDVKLTKNPSRTSLVVTYQKRDDSNQLKQAEEAIVYSNYDAAISIYKKILDYNSESKEALIGLAYAYSDRNSDVDLSNLEFLLNRFPQNTSIFCALANFYENRKEYKHSLEVLKQAFAIEPNNNKIILSLAVIYDRMGDLQKALKFYQKQNEPVSKEVQRRMHYLKSQVRIIETLELD